LKGGIPGATKSWPLNLPLEKQRTSLMRLF